MGQPVEGWNFKVAENRSNGLGKVFCLSETLSDFITGLLIDPAINVRFTWISNLSAF